MPATKGKSGKQSIQDKAKRSGGPNPGAMARKELVGAPLGKQWSGFISGAHNRKFEGLGNAIAAVRQLQLRIDSVGAEEATALRVAAGWPTNATQPLPSDPLAGMETSESASGLARYPEPPIAGEFVGRILRQLGLWLATATPDDLSSLAALLESRPIEPSVRLTGNLGLRVADPGAFAASMAAAITPTGQMHRATTPEGIRAVLEAATPDEIEKLRSMFAPDISASTFRKTMAQLYEVKRSSGRPKT